MADTTKTLASIADLIDKQGGRFSVSAEKPSGPAEGRWMVGLEYGEEAPDSPMYAAASYGTGDTLEQALQTLVDEVGL